MPHDPQPVAELARTYTAAWNSGSAERVASHYGEDGQIVINRGEPWQGRSRIVDMATGFLTDVPDLALTCDELRLAGSHVLYVWTFTGHDAKTGMPLRVRGWYDADDYARQVAGA